LAGKVLCPRILNQHTTGPPPNYQKSRIKSHRSLPIRLDLSVKLKCQLSTVKLCVGIKYSTRDFFF